MRFLSEALHIAWLLPAAVPLFPGDLDEGALGELPVAPAVVADLLGKPVEAQTLVDRCAGSADHGSQLFLGVLFLFETFEFLPKLSKSSFLRKQESSPFNGFIDSRFRGNDKKVRFSKVSLL